MPPLGVDTQIGVDTGFLQGSHKILRHLQRVGVVTHHDGGNADACPRTRTIRTHPATFLCPITQPNGNDTFHGLMRIG